MTDMVYTYSISYVNEIKSMGTADLHFVRTRHFGRNKDRLSTITNILLHLCLEVRTKMRLRSSYLGLCNMFNFSIMYLHKRQKKGHHNSG